MTPSPDLDTQNLTRRCHEALILAVVEEGPHHGYQLALEIEERSRGFFHFNHGTLYPILHKMESEGLIVGAWDASRGGRRRRQYSLTGAGGERLGKLRAALSELVLIHSDSCTWSARIAVRAQPFWERMAFALIVVFLAILVVSGIDARLLSLTNSFVWPVLALFVVLVVSSIVLGIRFARDQNHRRLRERLVTPLFLGAASLVVGFGGFAFELYRGFLRMSADIEQSSPIFLRAFFGGTTTLMLAILVALCAALVWFVAAGRVARLERSAAATFKEV